MCGIAGYISDKTWNYKNAIDSLQHRGPNGNGSFLKEINRNQLFLGHTRLSIQDLSDAGQQPMFSDSRSIAIVFNGEIYNFKELKKSFFNNASFHSETDTEVILKLYQKIGLDFVNHLNGAFSIVIYDASIQKLFLIRDRLGIKPLYIYHYHNTIAFASELKVFKALELPFVFNTENLENYLVFKYSPQNETLVKNCRKVAPATITTIDLNTLSVNEKTYWKPVFKPTTSISYHEAQEQLFQLMQNAVDYRLIADVSIGNFLSGGVDSSIIAYFLKQHKDITHYCAVKSKSDIKKEGTTSDASYAYLLAKKWQLPFEAINIGSEQATQELIKTTTYFADDLIADGSQIPSFLITKKAGKKSRVILSGMGADELFFGYAGHQLTLLDKYFSNVPFHKQVAGILANINAGKGNLKAFKRYLIKLGKYHNYPIWKYGLYNIVGDYENSLALVKTKTGTAQKLFQSYFNDKTNVFEAIHQFERTNFLQKNLNYIDRMSMANNVESRVPFLDHRIAELAYTLPRNYKLSNTFVTKKIVKDTFKKQLPHPIIARRKAGFGMPLRSIFSNKETINHLLDNEWLNDTRLINTQQLNLLIDNHIKGKEDNSALIYAVISLQIWHKQWIEH